MSVSSPFEASSDSLGYVGPRDPLEEPIGPVEELHCGVKFQRYQDGTEVQFSAKIGEPLRGFPCLPLGGRWMGAFEEGDRLYIAWWYPGDSWPNFLKNHMNRN